jgi:hypothetical protein
MHFAFPPIRPILCCTNSLHAGIDKTSGLYLMIMAGVGMVLNCIGMIALGGHGYVLKSHATVARVCLLKHSFHHLLVWAFDAQSMLNIQCRGTDTAMVEARTVTAMTTARMGMSHMGAKAATTDTAMLRTTMDMPMTTAMTAMTTMTTMHTAMTTAMTAMDMRMTTMTVMTVMTVMIVMGMDTMTMGTSRTI